MVKECVTVEILSIKLYVVVGSYVGNYVSFPKLNIIQLRERPLQDMLHSLHKKGLCFFAFCGMLRKILILEDIGILRVVLLLDFSNCNDIIVEMNNNLKFTRF